MALLPEIDWPGALEALDARDWAALPNLLCHTDCDAIANLYDEEIGFRSRVVMARHGFGRGE